MQVLVIGAGIAGLGAATFFSERGHRVRLIESANRVGGRATTIRSRRGDCVDAGTQYFHTNYTRARRLMGDVGMAGCLTKIAGPTRFFDDRVRNGYFDVSHRLPWFPPAGISNLKAAVLLAKAALHLRDPHALGSSTRYDLQSALEVIRDCKLNEFLLRPLLLAGSLAEPDDARPSVLHVLRLLKVVVLTDYLVLPRGVASFHEALAVRLNVTLDTPVKRLVVEKDAIIGVEVDGNGDVLLADHVVVATPPPHALDIIPEDWTEERAFLKEIKIPAFSLPTFFLDRPLDSPAWSYMMQANKRGYASFVIDAARKSPAMVKSGNSALQVWVCRADVQRSDVDDKGLVDCCRQELEKYFGGISDWIEDVQVTRHACAVPFYPVGHQQRASDFLRRVERRKGVSFCGDYLSGGFMEAALWSAERAAASCG